MRNPISFITRFIFPSPLKKDLSFASTRNGVVPRALADGILGHLNSNAEVLASGTQMTLGNFAEEHRMGSTCLYAQGGNVFFSGRDDAARGFTGESTGLKVEEPLILRALNYLSRYL